MSTIRIQRSSEYNNRLRDYKIFIDGQQAGIIANGETKEFATTDGPHTITAKIDWCSSPDISIKISNSETKQLKVGGFNNGNWFMPLAGGIIALHFLLRMTLHIDYVIYFVIPVFFILMYYLTIGRKKYLTLQEIG